MHILGVLQSWRIGTFGGNARRCAQHHHYKVSMRMSSLYGTSRIQTSSTTIVRSCEFSNRLLICIIFRAGMVIIQRNIRSWCTLRTWEWFKLYGKVKPLIKGSKQNEEYELLEKKCKDMEENYQREERLRKDLETANANMQKEKQALFQQLEQERDALSESEERAAKLLALKSDVEKQVCHDVI